MDTSGFITSLVTSLILLILIFLVYWWCSKRPCNFVIYYPTPILKGLGAPEDAQFRSPWKWIIDAWHATEEEIVLVAGLDAAVYLNLLDTALKILGYSAIFGILVLVPLAATSNQLKQSVGNSSTRSTYVNSTFSGFDTLDMTNLKQNDPKMWAFLVGVYWLSISCYMVLWKKYKHIILLRGKGSSSLQSKPEHYTVLVRDIPLGKNCTLMEQVDTYFRQIHRGTYEKSIVVTNFKKVFKCWKELEKNKKKLAHAEVAFAKSKTKQNPEGTRPFQKTGILGLSGQKVDSMDFYRDKIKGLKLKYEDEKKKTLSKEQQSSALVIFNKGMVAAAVGQSVHSPFTQQWHTSLAPQPQDIVWNNLSIPYYQRLIRQAVVYAIVFFTVCFSMIPISFISALTTLTNLQKALPFLKPIVKIAVISSVLEAYLPQLVLIIFLKLLPIFLHFLSKLEGIPAQSDMMWATSGKFFYCMIFNVFLGVALSSSLFDRLDQIEKEPGSIMSLLGESLTSASSFFVTFIALKFSAGHGSEVSRILPLIKYHLKRMYAKTTEEIREAWEPDSFQYSTSVPTDLLILTIAICYAVIAPMVLPFGFVYFALGWIVLRNQALKVNVPKFESGGRMWPHIHNRIVVGATERMNWDCDEDIHRGKHFVRSVYRLLLAPQPLPLPDGWHLQAPQPNASRTWRWLWDKLLHSKVSVLWWQVIHRCPRVIAFRHRYDPRISAVCPLCLSDTETLEHCLFYCPEVQPAWSWLQGLFNSALDCRGILLAAYPNACPPAKQRSFHLGFGCLMWSIWERRR